MARHVPDLRVVSEERIEPHAGGVIQAFRRIGYKLPEALADLVDNSIDAEARQVLIRFFCTDSEIRRIVIADDGSGMDEERLRHGMQFGAAISHHNTDLGKFGTGLKSASFSQCRKLSVVTRQGRWVGGRQWTVDSIRSGWSCSVLDPADCAALLDFDWKPVDLKKHGTLIVWDDLDAVEPSEPQTFEGDLRKIMRKVSSHLGLVFHRFIPKKLALSTDVMVYGSPANGVAEPVLPLDPFKYETPGNPHYPKTFTVKLQEKQTLKLIGHIWPAKAKSAEYNLPGGAASRQGFYFYRNDRLIQAGGWNKLRGQDSEPHSSLARVAIDLPPTLDDVFHIGVQKSLVEVPPGFDRAVREAKAGQITFGEYIKHAEAAYRGAKAADPRNRQLVPGEGLPKAVRRVAEVTLAPGRQRKQKIRSKWAKLSPRVFFEIDREKKLVILNERYRQAINGNRRASKADAGVVKTLLFLLLEEREEFHRERVNTSAKQWLAGVNDMLIAALEAAGLPD